MTRPANPFHLHGTSSDFDNSLLGKLRSFPIVTAEHALGLSKLAHMYETVRGREPVVDFLQASLDIMDVRYELNASGLENIPKSGPVFVVANHPFGGIEGIILCHLLSKVRPDFKIMANFLLGRVPEIRDCFIFVDPFGTEAAAKKNLSPLRDTIAWLRQGGVVGTFPSGTVSHFDLRTRRVSDPDWSPTIARIVRKTQTPVVPIFFNGLNGPLFQLLGLIHPRLRTAALPRELLNRQHSTIKLAIGKPIPYERLQQFSTDEEITAYLRFRTYILEERSKETGKKFLKGRPKIPVPSRVFEPIVAPEDPALLKREVVALPPQQLLIENNEHSVYYARATQIPHILQEIGRLREYTFRQVHEGTGKSIDLDRFDNYYIHLFVWNKKAEEIVGAYRLGKADQILRRFGVKGLYTSTLFNYDRNLLAQIGPALELGRSFVRPEYQKSYSPLLLLWKGIGHYVVRHPKYRKLFGPVSINNEYDSLSRELIVAFLQANNYLPELAKLIKARNPLRNHRSVPGLDAETLSIVVKDVEEVSALISEIEDEDKSIPVLLRQYLKLGGKLLGFNVDTDFGDVLDGLILVDLYETDRKLLDRYLGKEGVPNFLEVQKALANEQSSKTGTR